MDIASRERQSFYSVGLLGLRALQDRGLGAIRFSPDADARWKAFRGELSDSDRLDLLLWDGAATQRAAFSAAAVFDLPDLALDEPFGPDWSSLQVSDAGPLLRRCSEPGPAAKDQRPSTILSIAADVWGLAPAKLDTSAVAPASRVVAAGAGAVSALADHMAGRSDTDFADQILFVTDRPGERQLFGLASALCGSRSRPKVVGPSATIDTAKALRFDRCTIILVSADADGGVREVAERLGHELGA